MTIVYIPAGPFMMGSDKYAIERPLHTVTLDAYWMDLTEVSNAQYALCEADGACTAPGSVRSNTTAQYYGNDAYAAYPMVNITWEQAMNYCLWAGGYLPSEAQWEKAARGDADERPYPWGSSPANPDLANYGGNVGDVMPVGSYPLGASPYGLLDMAGNVREWTADFWDSNYYVDAPAENPTGPESGTSRVVRDGAYGHDADFLRVSYRNYLQPDDYGNYLGFRCVMPVQP